MADIRLGPSPNWYLCNASDCNQDGILSYGSRGDIVSIDTRHVPPVYLAVMPAHKDRITAVGYCKTSKRPNQLVTAGEDGRIKLWNITEQSLLLEQETVSQKVNCVKCLPTLDDCIIGSDEKGLLIQWKLSSNETFRLHTACNASVVILESCNHCPHLIAVGYKKGMIAVQDVLRGGAIQSKFLGHEQEVLSLSWASLTVYQQGSDLVGRLISASRDKTVRVWDLDNNKCLHVFQVTHSAGQRAQRNEDENRAHQWICAKWMPDSEQCFLSTNLSGSLLLWNLNSDEKPKGVPYKMGSIGGHSRIVFNICLAGTEKQWACTVSLDRQIVFWDLIQKKSAYVFSTLGGFVYCLASSPLDPAYLAVGVGDSMLRVWNTRSATTPYHATAYWQGIKGKVMSLAWHPEKEGCLALGTDSGKVALIQTLSGKPPVVSSSYHKDSVYTVCWGLCQRKNGPGNETRDFWYLYSCGDGRILIHNMAVPTRDATDFDDLVPRHNSSRHKGAVKTDLAWKPDFTVLSVGYDNGHIDIHDGISFYLLLSLQVQKKMIQCLKWHPSYTAMSSSKSAMHCWLAASSNEDTIHVYDLSVLQELSDKDGADRTHTMTKSKCQLSGHRGRVPCLAWSPHAEGQLASAAYDGTAQVWDTISGQPRANYRGHRGRVFSIEWHNFDPDMIFTGGEDYTVHQWRISEQSHRCPPVKKERVKTKKSTQSTEHILAEAANKVIHKIQESEQPGQEVNGEGAMVEPKRGENEVPNIQPALTDHDLPSSANIAKPGNSLTGSSYTSSEGQPLKVELGNSLGSKGIKPAVHYPAAKKKQKKGQKSLFPVTSTLESRGKSFNHDDCKILLQCHCTHSDLTEKENGTVDASMLGKAEFAHLGYFGDQVAAWNMLSMESIHHQNAGNWDCALQVESWKGNIGEVLKAAASQKQLNDWLLSIAPLASRTVWQKMCEAYANQLAEDGDYHKAVTYLLCCHKVYEAIELLKKNALFREAVALAKVRLPPSDPVLQELLTSWSSQASKDGNYEFSAKCFLAQQQPLEAANCLAKRDDAASLRIASYIASFGGCKTEAEAYAMSCLKTALLKQDWLTAHGMISEQPSMHIYKPLVVLHEVLSFHLQQETFLPNVGVLPLKECSRSTKFHLWRGYFVDGKPFLELVSSKWQELGVLDAEDNHSMNMYENLRKYHASLPTPGSPREVSFHIAIHLTLFLLWFHDKSSVQPPGKRFSQSCHHIADALAACYAAECYNLFRALCMLLFPHDVLQCEDADVCEERENIQDTNLLNLNVNSLFWKKPPPTTIGNFISKSIGTDGSEIVYIHVEAYMKGNKDIFTITSVMSYFCHCILHSLSDGVQGSSFLECQENLTSDSSGSVSGCAQACDVCLEQLLTFIEQLIYILLNEHFAIYYHLQKMLLHVEHSLAVMAASKLQKKESDMPQAQPPMQTSTNCNSDGLPFGILKMEHQEDLPEPECTELSTLQKKRQMIKDKLREFSILTQGVPFPDPMKAAVQIKELCHKLSDKCSATRLKEVTTQYISVVSDWEADFLQIYKF